MGRFIIAAIAASAAACFSPSFPNGVPCSVEGNCPGSQICAADNRCYDEGGAGADANTNGDSSLSALEVSLGTLEPAFDPTLTAYALTLGLGAEELSITATATVAAGAEITVDETIVASSVASPAVALNLGDNSIEIVVTAASGDQTSYAITTNRGAGTLQGGYIKSTNAEPFDGFHAVSMDGDTLVVGAPGEDSQALGIGGDQTDNSNADSGAVYVFVKNGAAWSQQAYIKASNTDQSDRFGSSVSLSGNTLAVGAVGESSNATGVDGNQNENSATGAGAVYVFVRSGSTWSQQAYIKASNTGAVTGGAQNDNFGASLSCAGNTELVNEFERLRRGKLL